MVNLEVRLADAAILMFERLIGGLFTRARRGQQRRYQDTAPSGGKLMRLFGATIAAQLRRACQAGLNKGEARHALAGAIYTNRQGRFTDRTLENQQYRASGLNLLIAAIAYWNTLYLGRAADHLRYSGVEINGALLAHVSPLDWSHIGLTGDYLWEDAWSHGEGGYRALHDPSGTLKLVA